MLRFTKECLSAGTGDVSGLWSRHLVGTHAPLTGWIVFVKVLYLRLSFNTFSMQTSVPVFAWLS